MATGVAGRNGLAVPRHVDLEIEAGQESVTTQLQLMEAETARDQAQSLDLVTPILVEVTNALRYITESTTEGLQASMNTCRPSVVLSVHK